MWHGAELVRVGKGERVGWGNDTRKRKGACAAHPTYCIEKKKTWTCLSAYEKLETSSASVLYLQSIRWTLICAQIFRPRS